MLHKLEMLIAVAKEQHFGRAATSLGITQPTLSTGIRQLEEQLGVQLVFRSSRYGGLTPEGQSALVWARRIVSDARQLKEEMQVKRRGFAGELRVAVIPTALTWAARLTTRFGELHPNVRFTILSRTSIEILAMIDNLDVDAGISYLDNEPTGRVITEPLYEERYCLICAPAAPFAGRESAGWEDLEGEMLALLTPDMQNRRIIDKSLNAAGVSARIVLESDSPLALVANVMAGNCLTILPEDIARFLATGTDLSVVPLRGAAHNRFVGVVAPWREPRTPVLDALLAEARRISAGSP
ncbi:LysR family transcriptional regulator [Paracoccus sp. Z118]|uniref:LysR family transcriptional regulator n=1 Tax=Paracoccus sp. Z118 TaxID=2851017 RepID=UPI001C2C1E07|nr:LysR family transcriptional regulator [Paracoccus sp. Z118]MBV0892085.1 LysR family transcriptional regulator [Paracoccus sp. Z118]